MKHFLVFLDAKKKLNKFLSLGLAGLLGLSDLNFDTYHLIRSLMFKSVHLLNVVSCF